MRSFHLLLSMTTLLLMRASMCIPVEGPLVSDASCLKALFMQKFVKYGTRLV